MPADLRQETSMSSAADSARGAGAAGGAPASGAPAESTNSSAATRGAAPAEPAQGATNGAATPYIGAALRRKEDPRLLRGDGRFVADVRVPGLLHAAFLRSPHAHARIRSIDLAAARALPGVVAVYAHDDLLPWLKPLPMLVPHPALRPRMHYPLAKDKVRYVGEAVAVAIAEDPYLAEDALEA